MATDRVFKTYRVVHFASQTKTADGMLDLSDSTHRVDLTDVDWQRIVVEVNVTAHTGTNFVLDGKTCIDPNFDFSDTEGDNVQAVQGDGSTAFASATITTTGRYHFATTRDAADGSAASNIGTGLGLFFDNNATSVTLEAWVYIQGQ